MVGCMSGFAWVSNGVFTLDENREQDRGQEHSIV